MSVTPDILVSVRFLTLRQPDPETMTRLGTILPGSPREAFQAWPKRRRAGGGKGQALGLLQWGAGGSSGQRAKGRGWRAHTSGSEPADQPGPQLLTQSRWRPSPAWLTTMLAGWDTSGQVLASQLAGQLGVFKSHLPQAPGCRRCRKRGWSGGGGREGRRSHT